VPPDPCFVPRERFLNFVRARGYKFKRQALRIEFYKRGTDHIAIPRRDLLEERWVRIVLAQRGVPPNEVDAFIRNAKN